MKIHNFFFVFWVSILTVFFISSPAEALQAKVLPSEINPGDAFVIKVTEVKALQPPAAVLNKRKFYFTNCGEGCFVAVGAVGIDTKPGRHTIELSIREKNITLSLPVKHAEFPELHITLPEEKVFLSPENQNRAEKEAEKLNSIWQILSDKLWEGSFIMPLENEFSTAFGIKRIINKKKISVHKGTDIKGKKGEPVKASNKGKVVLAEELFFGGNTIILDHGLGIYTVYMHLSKFNVQLDDIVSKGAIIGFVGSSGRASGPHLHFGVKVLNVNVNPASFVKLGL